MMNSDFILQRNILMQADDFFEAYRRCIKGENLHKENGRLCASVVNIPAIVNASFACELYIKSMISDRTFEHNLKNLFDLLPKETQNTISNSVNDKLAEHPVYNFEYCLENAADVFIDWRYIYEDCHTEGFYGSYINEYLMFFEKLLPILKEIAYFHNSIFQDKTT